MEDPDHSTTSAGKSTKSNVWNVSTSKVSFASIVASQKQEQEETQKKPFSMNQDSFIVDDDLNKAMKESLVVKTKEDEDLELAIQLSLQQEHQQEVMTAINELESDEVVARKLSNQLNDGNDNSNDKDRMDKESLALAMYLQQLDRENYAIEMNQRKGFSQGNVHSVYADEFASLKSDKNDQHRDGERILWSHEDADQHDDYYRQIQPKSDSVDEEEDEEKVGLFQMNSNTLDGNNDTNASWRRLDKNSIVSPDGKEIRTKHDMQLNKQLNADKLYNIEGSSSKINMDHNTYQSFKKDLKKQWGTIKGVAASGHGRAENMKASQTRGGAMDGNVRIIITKALNAGRISACYGVVKEGKEALVYYAEPKVAVKVFKRITEFRNRMDYVQGDPRFFTVGKKCHTNKRQLLEQWTEKEFRNLVRALRAGVPVPKPLEFKENVLFLNFLGTQDGWPCPQLKEVKMSSKKKWTFLYQQTLVAIRQLYHGAKLVHGDLSEYNILLCPNEYLLEQQDEDQKPQSISNVTTTTANDDDDDDDELRIVLIDFGQAVDIHHPTSQDFLQRDCENIRSFFQNQKNILTLTLQEQLDYILEPINTKNDKGTDEYQVDSIDDEKNNDSQIEPLHRHCISNWNYHEEMNKIGLLLEGRKKILK